MFVRAGGLRNGGMWWEVRCAVRTLPYFSEAAIAMALSPAVDAFSRHS